MARMELCMDAALLKRVKSEAKKAGFKNAQEYIRDLVRAHLHPEGVSLHKIGEALQKDIRKIVK